MTIEFLDIEWLIREDKEQENSLIISVQSRMHNCSSHLRYSDTLLKEKGISGLLKVLNDLQENLIYQKTHGLIEQGK